MKVIDLLNKIANGEDVPERIKYDEKIYNFSKYSEWYLTDDMLYKLFIDENKFNDEVEIIEDTPKEDKKIEKDNLELDTQIFKYNPTDLETLIIREMLKNRVKIEKIIDKINGDSNE